MTGKFYISFLSTILLFSIALGVDFFFFNGDRFWEMELHPFLFIVTIVSIQYGTNNGLIAATLATLALLVGNLPEQTIFQDTFDYIFYVSYRPMFWVALAVLFGGFRDRYWRNLIELKENLAIANKQTEDLGKGYHLLDKERSRLETNLSSQSSSVLSLHQAALKLNALEPFEIFSNTLEITEAVMKSEKCSWYFLSDSTLKVAHKKGWQEYETYSESLPATSLLFQKIVDQRTVVNITNPKDEVILKGEGILAGPIINRGKVYGMIKVEELGFLGLNLSNIETFKALCEWFGTLLEVSTQIQVAQSKAVQNPETKLFTRNYFDHITEFISHLGERSNFENQTLSLKLSEEFASDPKINFKFEKLLGEISSTTVRKTDLVFEDPDKKFEYIVLLPNTSVSQALKVSEKITRLCSNRLGKNIGNENFSVAINSLEKKNVFNSKIDKKFFPVLDS